MSLTRISVVPHNRLDRKLDRLAIEARQLGFWDLIAQNNKLCYAETLDLQGVIHTAMVLHGDFPMEIVPPYVLSQHLQEVATGLLEFTHNPLDIGMEAMGSLRQDAGGRARVEVPLSALEEWEARAEEWIAGKVEEEARRIRREEEKAKKAAAKEEEWKARADRARAEREREAERVRASRAEQEAREAAKREAEERRKAEAIAAWEEEERRKAAEEEARRKAMEERRKARAAAKLEDERLKFAMFFIEIASVAELILEQRRASDPLRPLREQGGERVEISPEGWEVWEYPAGRYSEIEGGEGGEGGEGEGSEGGVTVHQVEGDLPYLLDVVRLHVSGNRRAWEDQRGFFIVTGDDLSLHLVTEVEIALALIRKEWRVREAQVFRGEGYCRKVRRQDGWDGRLESAVEELG